MESSFAALYMLKEEELNGFLNASPIDLKVCPKIVNVLEFGGYSSMSVITKGLTPCSKHTLLGNLLDKV